MNTPPEISIEPVSEWLTQAIIDVSETMFALAARPSEPTKQNVLDDPLLIACIGIRGDCQLEVAMDFPKNLADHLAGISLEIPAAELEDKMVDDVAGEFSNMVVGAVKSRLSDLEVACSMTVPRVVRAEVGARNAHQKVQAAMAVIRGAAGPRAQNSAVPVLLTFQVGPYPLNVHLYL